MFQHRLDRHLSVFKGLSKFRKSFGIRAIYQFLAEITKDLLRIHIHFNYIRFDYCMPNKSCPFSCSDSLYQNGLDFLGNNSRKTT